MKGHAEGNYLHKSKRTYHVTDAADNMLLKIGLELGLTKSGAIEIIVREKYRQLFGGVIEVNYKETTRG